MGTVNRGPGIAPPAPGADGRDSSGSPSLLRNTAINLGGQVLPLLVALIAIPFLIQGLGTERFGVFALVWVAIGYFGFLDLGVGRALTQMVAERMTDGREREVPGLVRTGVALMAGLAVLGTAVLWLFAEALAMTVLSVPEPLRVETIQAFQVLALSLPAVVASAGYRGALEGFHRFGVVNAIKVPGSTVGFLGPVAVLPFSDHLVAVVGVLVLSRIAVFFAYVIAYRHHAPAGPPSVSREFLRPLLTFGGWMTVSNVVSPLMVYVDRFLIGAFLSVTAVAYYVTPHEVVMKLIIIPGAVAAVFFPAFAAASARRSEIERLARLGVKATFALLLPIVLIAVLFAHEGLSLWVGSEFAAEGAQVLQLLAIGVLVNAVGQIIFVLVQGLGRADVTAKLHLLELPIYVAMILIFIPIWGIMGAALAWTIRVTMDTALLWWAAARIGDVRILRPGVVGMVATGASVLLLGGSLLEGPGVKSGYLILTLAGCGILFWKAGLSPAERDRVVGVGRLVRAAGGR
jgi:O-antigen/teichoic acid export membrane protein